MYKKLSSSFVLSILILFWWTTPVYAGEFDSDPEFQISTVASGNLLTIHVEGSQTTGGSSESPVLYDQTSEFVVSEGGRSVRVEVTTGKAWCDRLFREILVSHPCDRHQPTREEPVEEEVDGDGGGVDAVRVLYTAVALARVDGAGVVVEPGRDWVWMNVPTLAHAQTDTVETSVRVFDLDVPVVFQATRFVFDFHDGNPPVISTVRGAPYPDMTIQGTYTAESERMFVTLATTWDATVTHPMTGQELHVPGVLRTVENSRTFRVVRSRHRLIAPEEYGKTH